MKATLPTIYPAKAQRYSLLAALVALAWPQLLQARQEAPMQASTQGTAQGPVQGPVQGAEKQPSKKQPPSATRSGQKLQKLYLAQALELARKNNPALQRASQRIAEAEGRLIDASVLLRDNPELSLTAGPRIQNAPNGAAFAGASSLDLEIALEQRLEIAGQRSQRMASAKANKKLRAAKMHDVQRVVELAVRQLFDRALAAQERVALREQNLHLSQEQFELATRRLESGDSTPLEQNTALIRRAAARQALIEAQAEQQSTLLRLRQLIGLSGEQALAVQGQLMREVLSLDEDELLARALKKREDLRAAKLAVTSAKADLALARAQAWPDVSLAASYGLEEGTQIGLAGIKFGLPIFQRMQGERAVQSARVRRLQAGQRAQELAVETELRKSYVAFRQTEQAMKLYDSEVLHAQQQSLQLLQRAFAAGAKSYTELIVMQRELLEAQERFLQVRLNYSLARAQVLAAAALAQTASNGAVDK